jgi:hypothetical protein
MSDWQPGSDVDSEGGGVDGSGLIARRGPSNLPRGIRAERCQAIIIATGIAKGVVNFFVAKRKTESPPALRSEVAYGTG